MMKIIKDKLTIDELRLLARAGLRYMVKAVVDVETEALAVDAELHANLEGLLMENGSDRKNLWGINFYPDATEDELVEFDSMINVKPTQGNSSRDVEDRNLRIKILEIVSKKIQK